MATTTDHECTAQYPRRPDTARRQPISARPARFRVCRMDYGNRHCDYQLCITWLTAWLGGTWTGQSRGSYGPDAEILAEVLTYPGPNNACYGALLLATIKVGYVVGISFSSIVPRSWPPRVAKLAMMSQPSNVT
ncbi:hypothetical protein GGR51DRAFT_535097 [Nemania sp. FL0031]|nr:hypothetical protein GGR51DRAFT_535097 [Nemania sp. FL0031]